MISLQINPTSTMASQPAAYFVRSSQLVTRLPLLCPVILALLVRWFIALRRPAGLTTEWMRSDDASSYIATKTASIAPCIIDPTLKPFQEVLEQTGAPWTLQDM